MSRVESAGCSIAVGVRYRGTNPRTTSENVPAAKAEGQRVGAKVQTFLAWEKVVSFASTGTHTERSVVLPEVNRQRRMKKLVTRTGS